MKNALMIFVKNLQRGKVKTRLAATMGDDQAYRIYQYLLDYTYRAVAGVDAEKYFFYSDFLEQEGGHGYHRCLQSGADLGARMQNAFKEIFQRGAAKAMVIGSDNLEINSGIINTGFDLLTQTDIVIGPARDGGYYLLGMKALHPELFEAISWSTETVCQSTISRIEEKGLSYRLLAELRDIDEEQDWNFFNSRSDL